MHSWKKVQCNSEHDNFHKQLFNEVESIFITLKSFMICYFLVDYESNGTLKTVTEIPDRSLTYNCEAVSLRKHDIELSRDNKKYS